MTPHQKEHLHTQYVLTLVNDGDWYRRVRPYLQDGKAGQFINATCDVIGHIRRSLEDPLLSDRDRAYIYMACWSHYGYSIAGLINGCPFSELKKAMVNLQSEQAPSNTPTPEPEVQPVNQTASTAVAFETRHYVYGMDVANMTSGQLIEAIKKLEAEIADLKGVKAKSEHIKKRIAELDGMLAKVVEVLDAK